jgi:tetratricopeptide (TPR) repeat protein
MNRILIVIISMLITNTTLADSKQSMIDVANEYYANGDFSKAIELYEEVIGTGYEAAHLYFNLGNANYKTGAIPSAILNYERAKLLDPKNEDIIFNLELSNTHVVDQLEAIPEFFLVEWIRQLVDMFPTDAWAYWSLSAFLAFLVMLLIFLYSNISVLKRLSFYGAILALTVVVWSIYSAAEQKANISNDHSAIVFSPSVTIKSSPDDSGTDLFLLHEGTKVSLIDSLGDWINIRLSDGNVGWLEKRHLEII